MTHFRFFLIICLLGKVWAGAAQPALHTYIDPLIGSAGEGNVFVGPSCPFGMVKPGPDCSQASNSGYVADQQVAVQGFSQVHVSGTGGGPKYGNILVMPFSGDFESIHQESLRANETVKAGYYHTDLTKWGISAALTASHKVAFHRYTFAGTAKNAIKIDGGFFLGENPVPDAREAQQFVGSEVEVVSDTEVRGYTRIRGGWNNGSAYTVYYWAVFDQPFQHFSSWKGDRLVTDAASQFDSGEKTGVICYFENQENPTVQVKIGISFISCAKARENMLQEIPGWDFDQVLADVEQQWDVLLGRITIGHTATDEHKRMFYTGLYHTMLMPVDRSGENPLWTAAPYYDDFYAIWDTFRSSSPLITLIDPGRQAAIINGMLNIYRYDGYLPDARSGNSNGRTQGGSNAEVVIADAYAKNLPGVNYHLALKAMLKDATIPPGGNEEKEGRGGLTDYNRLGYVSTRFVRSGNRTLEYAYDDFCLAQVAKGLGRMGEYYRFQQQSDNWQKLWRDVTDHGARGFILPKDAAGQWVDSIQCDVNEGQVSYVAYTPLAQDWPNCVCWWCGFFYEASSWEYSFYVPHDVAAIIRKSGGATAFRERLDLFFQNGYYNVGNEPSFLTPTLYHWIGRPDLSSDRIHQIINHYYDASPAGIPGNDDSGAMSSWLAFHMLGLFPNAGQSYYLINTPFFEESTLHLAEGDFTIVARKLSDKNRYIQSATLNGQSYDLAWIEHQNLVNGGVLELQMGAKPTGWGTRILPPSRSDD